MVQTAEPLVSYEEYLAAESSGTTKHEWLDGVVYAMAGGSLEHSRLAGNVHTALKLAFPGCEVFQSDAMLFVRATGLSTYADVTLVCGPVEAQKVERNRKVLGEALVSPTVVVEVLSESTESYDRGEKFTHYMAIASLREYVLVSQHPPCVEVFRRPARGHWASEKAGPGESIVIHGARVEVDTLYRRASGAGV